MTGEQLYDLMILVKNYGGHVCGFAELARDVQTYKLDKDNNPKESRLLKKGTTIKAVMASRLGDIGITRNMKIDHGYDWRVDPDSLENCRLMKYNDLWMREDGWGWTIKSWDTDEPETELSDLIQPLEKSVDD